MTNWSELAASALDTVVTVLDDGTAEYFHDDAFVSIRGVFDNAHVSVEVGEVVGHSSTRPTLLVKRADLPAPPARGGRVKVQTTTYRIIDSQEDGQGGALLILNEE
jgi:hypothetical protein